MNYQDYNIKIYVFETKGVRRLEVYIPTPYNISYGESSLTVMRDSSLSPKTFIVLQMYDEAIPRKRVTVDVVSDLFLKNSTTILYVEGSVGICLTNKDPSTHQDSLSSKHRQVLQVLEVSGYMESLRPVISSLLDYCKLKNYLQAIELLSLLQELYYE